MQQQRAATAASQQPSGEEPLNTIVEEKIVRPSGETITKRYLKGKFLGKVSSEVASQSGRVREVLRVHEPREQKDAGCESRAQGLADQEQGKAEGNQRVTRCS